MNYDYNCHVILIITAFFVYARSNERIVYHNHINHNYHYLCTGSGSKERVAKYEYINH